jgi:hypothetical protein
MPAQYPVDNGPFTFEYRICCRTHHRPLALHFNKQGNRFRYFLNSDFSPLHLPVQGGSKPLKGVQSKIPFLRIEQNNNKLQKEIGLLSCWNEYFIYTVPSNRPSEAITTP